jgi:HAD superfamily hydrolase (TIGR01509 family)
MLDKTGCSMPYQLDSLLLLDIGGVLLENVLRAEWWKRLAQRSGHPAAELEQMFACRIKPALWTGRMSPSDFWKLLATVVDPDDPGLCRQLQRELKEDLQPLPAIFRIAEWARQVHVALLSNNVSEWLEPHIARFELHDACDFILISDQTGLRKPDRRAFQCALDQWRKPSSTVLCVDDNENNLSVASEIGMATLLAVPSGGWERQVDRWIEAQLRAAAGLKCDLRKSTRHVNPPYLVRYSAPRATPGNHVE